TAMREDVVEPGHVLQPWKPLLEPRAVVHLDLVQARRNRGASVDLGRAIGTDLVLEHVSDVLAVDDEVAAGGVLGVLGAQGDDVEVGRGHFLPSEAASRVFSARRITASPPRPACSGRGSTTRSTNARGSRPSSVRCWGART